MGVRRESRHLPPGRSRRRNAGRDPGRESPGRGSQGGAICPPARWVQGEPKSPWSRCNGDVVASAGTGSMPVSVKRPADQSLGESVQRAHEPRDSLGGPRGMWKSPRKVSAVLPRTPCTLLNNGTPPYFIIKENSLNCHEHYNDAIELCVMIIPFLLYSATFLLCARNFVRANIGLPAKEAARYRRG